MKRDDEKHVDAFLGKTKDGKPMLSFVGFETDEDVTDFLESISASQHVRQEPTGELQ